MTNTQIFIQFNDIDLLEWCLQKGFKFNSCSYIKAIKHGSCKILDWLWNHKINYDKISHLCIYTNIFKYGCKNILKWFIDKKILNLTCDKIPHNYGYKVCKSWLDNPNHKLLKYISLDNLCYLYYRPNDMIYVHLKSVQYVHFPEYFDLLQCSTKFLRTDIIKWII